MFTGRCQPADHPYVQRLDGRCRAIFPPMSSPHPIAVPRREALRLPIASVDGDAIAAWVLGFLPVLYLALKNGGYDTVISGQVGVIAWWGVVLIALVGLMPRIRTVGWVGFALLAFVAAWTAVGISGAASDERALAETARVASYAGFLALALVLQSRAGSRHLLNGAATAIGIVTALAVLSRLHPQWFPANAHVDFLQSAERRLSYPLNYWNALASFMAIGAVLLLGVSATARTRVGQGVAAAAVPIAALGVFLCISRGGAIVFLIGVVAFLALTDDRLSKLATVLVTGVGSTILISAADQREAVKSGIDSAAARSEGAEMIWLCLIVCLGVALVHVAINLLARHAERPRWMQISSRQAWIATATAVPVVLVALIVSGAPAELSDRWDSFKEPPQVSGLVSDADVFARLNDSAGQGRYQYWQQALDAYRSDKLTGVGGGSFALWWAPRATIYGPVQDAHNLYLQTLAEVGLPGFLALLAFVALTLLGGVRRAMRNAGDARVLIAAATAGILIFWTHATVEWTWQLAVMPLALMIMVAVVLGQRSPHPSARSLAPRGALAVAGVLAVVPILLATTGAIELRQSQQAAGSGDYAAALADARTAAALDGDAMTPKLQQALIYEQAGDLRPARALAVDATEAEPENWKPWLIRARIETKLGRIRSGLRSYRRARDLNPMSPLFS